MTDIWNQVTQSFGTYLPKLIGALIILIVGWFVALIVSSIVRKGLKRTNLDDRLGRWLGGEKPIEGAVIEKKAGKVAYYLILILVFVAFFQILGLTIATEPLNNLLNQVFLFLPKILGAAIILLIAWVIANILKLAIIRALSAIKLDERLGKVSEKEGEEEEKGKNLSLSKSIAEAVYWLVFLIFLPAVLGALELTGLLGPLQGMIDKVFGFLPNILSAVLILLIGWFIARILRRVITNLTSAVGVDRLSERIGLDKTLGKQKLSGVLGLVVYIFILVPVLVGALNALALDAITEPTSNMLNIILEAIPSIFAASIVIVIAYAIGKVVSGLIANLLSGVGFDRLISQLGIWKEGGEGKKTPSILIGYFILVAIMLFAITEAANLLGFIVITDLMGKFMVLAGHILLGLFIFGVGLYLASLASRAIHSSERIAQPDLLSIVARIAILVLFGAMSLRQMGLANEIINLAFGLLLGAIAIATAIAFGIGGRGLAARKLEEWTGSSEKKDS